MWSAVRVKTLIGYEPNEMIGRTIYQFHSPLDDKKIQACFSTCKIALGVKHGGEGWEET